MTSWPTTTEHGVTYDIPNLLSTLQHHSERKAIKAWLLIIMDAHLNQLGIGIPLPNSILDAKWTLDHVTQLIALATIDQLKDIRVYVDSLVT
jgi:hypothetical protein